MKFKFGLITLLMAVMAFGVASTAFAAAGDLTVTATVDPATNNVTPGDSVHVVQAFTVTADAGGGNAIATIVLDGSVGGGVDMLPAEITRVAVYEDVNGNGTFDFNDALVMQKTSLADITAFQDGTTLAFDITDVTLAAGATKKYLAIIGAAEVLDETHSIDASVAVTATGAGVLTPLAGGNDDAVEITATHFKWIAGGYNAQVGTGASLLGAGDLLWAVDDFGNLDTDYVGEVQIKAEAYTDGSDITAGLTATIAGAVDITLGAAGFVSFGATTAGKVVVADLASLTHASGGPVTLVAIADPANTGGDDMGLQGSVTVSNQAYQAITGVQSTRGVEIYDVDHDGHIDHATIFFNAPVDPGVTDVNAFTVAGYTVASVVGNNFDAGGVGIRNGGQYSVTLKLTEKTTYDTGAKPDLTYTASAGAIVDRATALAAPSIVSATAIEVDKARPILLSIVTQDTDADGKVEGIKMTFSEPVTNVTATTAQAAAGGSFGNFAVALQNTMQGGAATSISLSGAVTGDNTNEVTVVVNETIPNTGILPVLLHNENNSTYSIRDAATSATGAAAANTVVTDFSTFVANTGKAKNVADGASPIITNVTTGDNNANGKIDRLVVTFSEAMNDVAAYAFAGVSGYSAVPGFGSSGAAAGSYTATAGAFSNLNTEITYTITEAAAAVYDTEAKPTIYYNPVPGNLRDANGFELAEYGPGARVVDPAVIIDGAAPVLVKMETYDTLTDNDYAGASAFEAVGANGRLDKMVLVFSEQVKTANYASSASAANFDAALAQLAVAHEDAGGIDVAGAMTVINATTAAGAGENGRVTPTWVNTDNGGDTQSAISFFVREITFANLTASGNSGYQGDTGVIPTIAYSLGAAANQIKDVNDVPAVAIGATAAKTVDKAAPFITNGIGKGYAATAFANVITVDDSAAIAVSDSFNGDGYIDAFELRFSEKVRWLSASAGADSIAPAFTVTNTANYSTITLDKGVDANLDGAITAADKNATTTRVIVYGTSSKVADKWDTGLTPTLSFNGSAIVYDIAGAGAQYEPGTDNVMAAFTSKASYDGAKPVIVRATGSVAASSVLIQFSENVYTNAAAADFTANPLAGNTIIKYDDYNTWGAKNVTAANVVQTTASAITVTVDSTLVLSDVEQDKVHVIGNTVIYDNANSVETGLADNTAMGSASAKPAGLMITINDTIAPWITAAVTVDADGDGLVDHIKFTLSENIKDASIKGYSAINALSADVAATWVIAGYTGTAKWNFFENTAAGQVAALAAGEPIFTDNGANDKVLYLRLDEALVPVSASGSGSTDFAPIITWGAGADAETMSDFKPNVLDTASTEATAVNGTVTDNVGPVMMSAKTTSTTTLDVTFSEDITLSTVAKGDFNWTLGTTGTVPAPGAGTDGWEEYIVNITKSAAGVARLEVVPDKAWTASTVGTLVQVGTVSDVKATPLAGVISNADPLAVADYYKANAAGAPVLTVAGEQGWVAASKTITVGIVSSSPDAKTVAVTAPTGAADLVAGTNVDVTWTAANTVAGDKVDVLAFDGTSWTVVANDLPATGVKYVWTAAMGVTKIKVQLDADAAVMGESAALNVVEASGVTPSVKTIAAVDQAAELTAGTAVNVAWAAANYSNNDRVDVLAYDGANWSVIASNYPVNADCVSWVPVVGVTKIKVQLAGDITVLDETADFVVITAPVTPPVTSGVAKLAVTPGPSTLPDINNKNVTAVKIYGTASADDTVKVKLVDAAGTEAEVEVVANALGNFSGVVDASPLANGIVTVKAGKAVDGVVAAWFTGADYRKDTIVIGAPAALVVTDVADDQGGFADVTFTKSDLETAGHDFYEVDYYVLQAEKAIDDSTNAWFTVATFEPDGNTDATFRATNVYVGSASTFRVNAVAKAGVAKPADAPSAMSSAYAYGTGSAIDNLLPGDFVAFAADGTAGSGVALSWTAPADHGLFNAQYGIYGVDTYEVYRRVVGTDEYVLVGTATPGSALFTDAVELGSTVYEYMVKAVDGAQVVESQVVKGMATEGANFDGIAGVSLGDLVIFGNAWGLTSADANYIINLDLDRNGEIGLGDLVLLGNAWTGAAKVAKAAELPTANVALNMSSEFNAENSVNYITISTEALDINGVEFSLKYDAEKYEFVSDSVTGLGYLPIVKANDGIVNIASVYGTEKFNGTITLGFKSKVQNAEMSVEMVNALVAINGELNLVNKAGAVSVKAVPSVYALSQNFPNPFNPTTTISYSIPQAGNVSLVIYNIAGQKVRTLVNDVQAPAVYKVVWDGRNDNGSSVATGMYFYKLVSGNYSKIVKMTLMK